MLIQIDGLGSGRTLGRISELRVSAQSGLRSERITSIVVTHRPSLIAHVDKILMLGAGRVQKFGPASEVMKVLQQQAQAMLGEKAA